MEGSLPTGSLMPGASYGMLDLQDPIHMHHSQHPHPSYHHHHHHQNPNPNNPQHQSSMVHPQMHEIYPHECNQHPLTLPMMDYSKGDRCKNSASDEDEPSFSTEDGINGHNECGKGKRGWQRMKWTNSMVRLLITAVSYLGEDVATDCNSGGRKKCAILQKKGKWKSISKVLAERGCFVSPQQCEDKFNDLNKRYKRLTDILGRGTTCKVVENPALLDMMDHVPNKAKEIARKILSSKHLFYEEMCSYHNGNRLNLPADPALQKSLQLALTSRDEHDTKRGVHDDHDDDDDMDSDDGDDDVEETGGSFFPKRLKKSELEEEYHAKAQSQGISVDMNQNFPEGSKADLAQKQYMKSRKLQLEEQSLQIQAEMLELKRQRFKWLRFSKKKDKELDKMRMENKRMKLDNERMALELKRKEMELDLH
ncbi:uncharacterized protein LOC109824110 [Asparagus officinalis]|uniref:uncharacterized protein LOC109824110 n=1 Tax=Asparagus officinalis TaxID=4686 RepID=UPI00098E5A78|nr:uncharacterized protein LOC109824110 [Asparagus officinalis]